MIPRPAREIITDFFNELNITFAVKSLIPGATTTVIIVDDAYYLRVGNYVIINGTEYIIINKAAYNSFEVNGVIESAALVTFQSPNFVKGTPEKVNYELKDTPTDERYPIIYLYEIIKESLNLVKSELIEREVDVRLFFLDENNPKNWDNYANSDKYFEEIINGLYRFIYYVLEKMDNSKRFGRIENKPTLKTYAKFGAFTELKGSVSSIFDATLSGIELTLTLPIYKERDC